MSQCDNCKQEFKTPLLVIFRRPYCGGCVLKGTKKFVRFTAALLGAPASPKANPKPIQEDPAR